MKHRRHQPQTMRAEDALARAIHRREWERVMLYVFVGIAETLRSEPYATIDDLLALLEDREATDER